MAPLDRPPGRAWRLTVDRTRVGHPRFSPDGRHIAYTTWRSLDPEIHLAPVDGGPARRLTYWGTPDTRVCGWTPRPGRRHPRRRLARRALLVLHLGLQRPGRRRPRRQAPLGPGLRHRGRRHRRRAPDAAAHRHAAARARLLEALPRRRHGPAVAARASGCSPTSTGTWTAPMFVGGRIAFLSDHEGVGNLYSCLHDGSDLRRHTDHDAFYARHASSDGTRVVYQCAGDLWIVDDLSAGSPPAPPRRTARRAARRAPPVPGAGRPARRRDLRGRDGPGQRRRRTRQPVLAHPPRRPGPHHRRHPGRTRPAAGDARLAAGRSRTSRTRRARTPIEIAYLPRASGDREPRRLASGRAGPRPGTGLGPGRANGWRSPSHDGGCCCSTHGVRGATGGVRRAARSPS